mmetsp:Transcript_9523/g.30471  ORF Transcript_9523/g.30471 Transcript_9523/m.30471 type:complete len:426 (-) Transcript_9523:999-2276(-)
MRAQTRAQRIAQQLRAPGAAATAPRSANKSLGCRSMAGVTTPQQDQQVLFQRRGGVQHVELNRPAKFNALNLDMVRLIRPHYEAWIAEAEPQCVLMSGAGDKAFCAGGDVAHIREDTLSGGSAAADFFYEEYQLNHLIATAYDRAKLVQVALWDGVTMGGGVGLSLHGKFRVATEIATFAMPETALGLFPDVGGTFALSRLRAGLPVGVYIALTGARLGAHDCLFSGLATHYVPRAQLPELIEKLQSQAAPPVDVNTVDRVLLEAGGGAKPPVDGKVKPCLEANLEGINACFGHATVEEIFAALEHYAVFNIADQEKKNWAESTLATLKRCSPASLKVTLRAVRAHAEPTVSVGAALQNEYRISQRMCEPAGDFFEGVRAILVDKDNKPTWAQSDISEVTDAMVDNYFAPLEASHKRGELSLPWN